MTPIDWPEGINKTIYIDPPWPERGGGKIKRGADRHYPVMSVENIKELPVKKLVDPDGSHLYLWATNNHLAVAFDCLEEWGAYVDKKMQMGKQGGTIVGRCEGNSFLDSRFKSVKGANSGFLHNRYQIQLV